MLPPDIVVRDATEADLPAIVAIYNATIPGRMVTADTQPVTVQERVPWFQAHNPRKRPLWVAIDGSGQISAWLSLNSFYGRPAYDRTVEVSLYVAENSRRRGLGRGLMERMVAQASAYDVRTMLGFIFGHNHASLQLFTSLGFEPWGKLPKVAVLDGIERDLIIVGRHVN
jgi:L-amino acid N-acyltransferase YncA